MPFGPSLVAKKSSYDQATPQQLDPQQKVRASRKRRVAALFCRAARAAYLLKRDVSDELFQGIETINDPRLIYQRLNDPIAIMDVLSYQPHSEESSPFPYNEFLSTSKSWTPSSSNSAFRQSSIPSQDKPLDGATFFWA
ncbi:hypothetical protein GJ744_011078 [Endocarpon pusillum]|uniref:Uncharacterized protein n=1 Tax=Endocarpon pusillum TaxID=364733 RepID=A0A8H7AH70_9EURO|nr:hypothetical protein GJ744_011078 [Endocarpon pusillum]